MLEKIKGLDPFLVIGTLFSIALAVILVILGQDQVTSLLIGLVSVAITIGIDVIARLKDTEKRILQATFLGKLLLNDQALHSIMGQIAESYLAAQASEFEVFKLKSQDVLAECKDELGSLKRGYMMVEPGGKYAYGRKGFDVAQKSIISVACENIEAWKTLPLQRVIQASAETVKRGVQVEQIFILSDDSLSNATDVLQAHKNAGVQVSVVSPEDLSSPQLLESYMIVDDQVLVIFYHSQGGRIFRGEKISIEPTEIERYRNKFHTTRRQVRVYE